MKAPDTVIVYWYSFSNHKVAKGIHSAAASQDCLQVCVHAYIHRHACMLRLDAVLFQDHVQNISANRVLDVAIEQEAAETRTFSCRPCLHATPLSSTAAAARLLVHLQAGGPQLFCAILSSCTRPNARGD